MPRSHATTPRGLDRPIVLVCLALALLCGACGGSSSSDGSSSNPPGSTPPTNTPVASDPVTVNGTERLGWTQIASSITALRAFTFFAYVDGTRSPLTDARCGSSAGPSGYDCSAALPKMTGGQHVIELATVGAGGMESARSAKLTVTMLGSGTADSSETAVADLSASSMMASGVAVNSCGDDAWQCSPIATPAAGLGPVTALESLPDGRLLVVESGTRILIQEGDTWNVGYEVANDPRTPTRIASVAPDNAFESTHFIYVAEVTTAGDGTRATRVLRTREVGNQLGEPSTIVAGETLVPAGDPVLSIGRDGLVYLAMPGNPAAADPSMRNGRLLRFTPDGSAAGTAATGSATLTDIAPRPRALAWDPQGRLWIAATGDASASAVDRVDAAAAGRWTRQPIALSPALNDTDAQVQSLAFSAGSISAGVVPVYLVTGSPAALYRGVMDSSVKRDALSALTTLPLGGWEPIAMVMRRDGSLIVAARQNTGAGEIRGLLQLTPSHIVSIHN